MTIFHKGPQDQENCYHEINNNNSNNNNARVYKE